MRSREVVSNADRGAGAASAASPWRARPGRLRRSIPSGVLRAAKKHCGGFLQGLFRHKILDSSASILIDDAKVSSGLNYGGCRCPIFRGGAAESVARYLSIFVPRAGATNFAFLVAMGAKRC